ncbi:MAG: sugar ABC transporter ATP-binding protein [Pirellulales bacterium]|jgi:ribose transport system ATP-binding protein|nr:sugar ABC transporter ATP-binding protein [Pirellulales bacterium]
MPLLSLKSIGKTFPGVRALEDVTVEVDAGEIVAVVGENGAGKSTLLRVLGGIHMPDEGEILIDGEHQVIQNVRQSMQHGIRLIHQELNLCDNLSIAENIFLGRQPFRGPRWFPVTNGRQMHQQSAKLLRAVGLGVSTHALVHMLSVGQQQLVEIAKALSDSARILVFDEPTSSLSLVEANRLLELIEQLRNQGTAILYVTHRLGEVTRLADRVVVLRDGRHVGTLRGEEIQRPKMISLMVGRDVQQFSGKRDHCLEQAVPALQVHALEYPAAASPLSFHIQPGEIVGFAGLVGAGRTELSRVLFGIDRYTSGEICMAGKKVVIRNVVDAIRLGLALVPEDRKLHGLVLPMSVQRNISMAALPKFSRWGWLSRQAERDLALDEIRALSVRTSGVNQRVSQLSGGNQQKVVLSKWLAMGPTILILDEPTRGVDVGAKSEIYRLIFDFAAQGVAVMMISSEMEEIVGIADRVVVMQEGRISGELSRDEVSEEKIMALALGEVSSQVNE